MNIAKLKSKMVLHGDTQSKLAEALGMTCPMMSDRMNGKVDFRRSEINAIRARYELTDEETMQIFFEEEVS